MGSLPILKQFNHKEYKGEANDKRRETSNIKRNI